MTAGLIELLEIKDSDIRILNLEQARDASDKGIHAGGAMSAVIPLVALYYGGGMRFDVADPTRPGQDLFVLSKGHAVAAMASVYADLGYFPRSVLKLSRSPQSLLKGHPGPLLPGVHVSTVVPPIEASAERSALALTSSTYKRPSRSRTSMRP